MAVQTALDFLRVARADEQIQRALAETEDDASADALLRIAREAGFDFTAAELDRAHTLDWRMRRVRYIPGT
jgi:predicted ribosomally synthesized peptide with nif11-like leader